MPSVSVQAPAAPAKAPVKKRIEYVDVMRGVCILLVDYFHSGVSLIGAQYVSHICVHPFFFMAGYFYNNKKSLRDSFKSKLRSLLVPYYVFALFYYVVWAVAFYGSGRDIIAPLRAVLFMPTDSMPVESAIYFFPLMFGGMMTFILIEKLVKPEWLKLVLVLGLTYLGNVWRRFCDVRLPMAMDCSLSVLVYFYLGYNGRAILARIDGVLEKIPRRWMRIALFIAAAVLNYICVRVDYIPNLRNGEWGIVLLTHLNTCMIMLLWVYFFRFTDEIRFLKPVNNMLKFIGKNSVIFMCFNHVGLKIGLAAATLLSIQNPFIFKTVYYLCSIFAVVPLVFLFNKTGLHKIFGK